MGKADLHIHTREGDGLDRIEAIFDHVEQHTGLDVIAITEHDSLEVALRAREVWARGSYRFDFVTGVELTTLQGHLIALYIEEAVASLQRIEDTIEAIHAQGGLCFVPHPMSWLTRSVSPATLERIHRQRARGLWFDGIELASASPASRPFLKKAHRLNRRLLGLPSVGASDAHFRQAIGSAYTSFEGSSAAGLRRAFSDGSTRGHRGVYPSLRDAGLLRSLSLPLVGLRATPKQLGWRRTAWSFASRYFA